MSSGEGGFDRRSFLVLMLQSLLLALFPWLRTEKGLAVAKQAAESLAPTLFTDVNWGLWHHHAYWHMVRGYTMAWIRPNECASDEKTG